MEDNTLDQKGKVKVEDTKKADEKKVVEKGEEGYVPTPNIDKEKPEGQSELKDQDVLSFLSKREGREIKSFDDLVTEKIVEKNVEYASEQLQTIDKYVRETGRSAKDWFNTQATDFKQMSSEQLVKDDLKTKFPKLSAKQVEIYFDNKYHIDSDNYDEDEIAVAKVELEIEAQGILKGVLEIQDKFRKPIEKKVVDQKKDSPENKKDNSEVENRIKIKQNWIDESKVHVDSTEKINIGKYEVKVDDETKEFLNKANSNLETFFIDNFRDENGVWDRDRLNATLLLAKGDTLGTVIGNIESNLLGQGAEGVIENRKNISLPGSKIKEKANLTKEQEGQNKAFADAMIENFT